MRDFWIIFKVGIINTFSLNKLKKRFGNKEAAEKVSKILSH